MSELKINNSCKICGGEKNKILGKPRIDKIFPNIMVKNYKIAQCENCRFYYIVPEIDLTQKEWALLYEKGHYFVSHQSEWSRNFRAYERRQRLNFIKDNSISTINRFF